MAKASRCLHCIHNAKTNCDLQFDYFNLKAARKCEHYADKRALNRAVKKAIIPIVASEVQLETKDKPRVRFYESEKVKFFFYV